MLLATGHAELAHENDVKRSRQRASDLDGDGNATARQPEDGDVVAAGVRRERARQRAAGVGPIAKARLLRTASHHGSPYLDGRRPCDLGCRPMPKIRVSDIEIDYRIDGDGGETLVLVNGLADTKESWAAQVPALAERYRVVSYDNRGVGGTTVTGGPYTTVQMAEDLHGLADALELDRFHLLG